MKRIKSILLISFILHIISSTAISHLKSHQLGLPEALVSLGLLFVFSFYSYLESKRVPDIRKEVSEILEKKSKESKELEDKFEALLKERDEKITDIMNQMGKYDFADKYDKNHFRF